ncbi:pentapeptide repeat-containing protein, partial [Haloquadratum walsbyi]
FSGADLSGAELTGADIRKAKMRTARVYRVEMTGCNEEYATESYLSLLGAYVRDDGER